MAHLFKNATKIAFMAMMMLAIGLQTKVALAQGFGVELHNTVMPAAGGMGGVSMAAPQDLLSSINANPATLTQFRGTQFTFSGAWIEPTVNMQHNGSGLIPGIGPFQGKSLTPGSAVGNIGVAQDFEALGRPVTMGVALVTAAGLGVDYSRESNSNYSAMTLQILQMQPAVGVQMTDRLSLGANFGLGIGLFEGLFVGSSKATTDYGARASFGFNYDVNENTKLGFSYQTKKEYNFQNAIILQPFVGGPSAPQDVNIELPTNLAIGFSNDKLADGRLLLAADVVYKFWSEAQLFRAIYENQLVVQMGAQYTTRRAKLRCGYVWAEDAMVRNPGSNIGGILPPGAVNAVQYIQALAPNFNRHRISGGIGIPNVLPGVDMDIFCGGMFRNEGTFGNSYANVLSYYIGGGMTWRFGRGSGCKLAPDEWGQRVDAAPMQY